MVWRADITFTAKAAVARALVAVGAAALARRQQWTLVHVFCAFADFPVLRVRSIAVLARKRAVVFADWTALTRNSSWVKARH